ncbi:hypothetical protein JW824_03840 [bacterium]|nr:hypothetical protein [bacterium]RQV97442.1 MAG: hypothetical protein EH221_03825 [bacterium]
MNVKWTMKSILICFLSAAFIVSADIRAEKNRKQAWEATSEIRMILENMLGDLDPTLPPPKLLKEPDFTWGLDNTVYWNSDSVEAMLLELGMNLLFFEVQARFNGTELWGFVDPHVDSATFVNLPEKTTVEYYLRYFAQDAEGVFYLSYWSDPETSIQDISPPMVWSVDILDLQESSNINWTIGPTISIHVIASDPNGQVMELGIREQNAAGDYYLYHAFEPPEDSVSISIPYTMRSNEKELSTLTIWVIDVAGQQSGEFSITLFWWPDEEEEIICFPNPFNPDKNEVSVIKFNSAFVNITEARIFDPFGNLIQVLNKEPSNGFFEWDGRNRYGDLVSNGGYICLITGQPRLYCKIAVLR